MSHFGQHARTRGNLRWRVLLVLGLLVGLLGMHALGPSIAMAAPEDRMPAHATHAAAAPVSAHADCDGCARGDGHDGGHGAEHADPTCASGAVGGACALPAPATAAHHIAEAASVLPGRYDGPAPERAPPSLAELQLLRI